MMKTELKIKKGRPYPLGATAYADGINFAVVVYEKKDSGLALCDRKKLEKEYRIPFDGNYFIGNICCIFVEGAKAEQYAYRFYRGDEYYADPYAKEMIGRENYGIRPANSRTDELAGIPTDRFDWENDNFLQIPYEDSVFYCMHVRGFTKSRRSGVKHKGTFYGIIEKIPYLRELGVRNLELMPAYDFKEWEEEKKQGISDSMQYALTHYMDRPVSENIKEQDTKINYWGYKKGNYFAPKASYAQKGKAIEEFKTMVRECHKNGIEVIMQFYFPDECKPGYILEVLKYWVLEYHVDGFHLMGTKIPLTLIATEAILGNTKLIYYDFPYDEIYHELGVLNGHNLANANDVFMNDARKYIKGDENLLECMKRDLTDSSDVHGNLHYITNYNGFTLADLVSYDRKHNEANGEENRDGTDWNNSWNCGMEGDSKKSAIRKLRKKQMKNAMVLVTLSQGTPFFTAGDEDYNTQDGNNNPYCQDNETGWKNWQTTKQAREQYAFVKELLRFRKEHAVFHKRKAPQSLDPLSCGFPEISFHSEEAFRLNTAGYNRHMAVLYAGAYGDGCGRKDQDIYMIYNMHWVQHRFALPKLKKGYLWVLVMNTEEDESFVYRPMSQDFVLVQGRSIQILISEKITEEKDV